LISEQSTKTKYKIQNKTVGQPMTWKTLYILLFVYIYIIVAWKNHWNNHLKEDKPYFNEISSSSLELLRVWNKNEKYETWDSKHRVSCSHQFLLKALLLGVRVRAMLFNATFNNISAISSWSVLLAKETREPRANHRPAASHWQTLSHNVVSSTRRLNEIQTHVYFWYPNVPDILHNMLTLLPLFLANRNIYILCI
jgi:hypothetical protein